MNKLIPFSTDISKITLPAKFGYPHYYTPHTIAKIASEELQNYLENEHVFNYNFGLADTKSNEVGKMFGVLVVKTSENNIGYLCAFSGRIADKTSYNYFVPPVFDLLHKDSFYKAIENQINNINKEIDVLENNETYKSIMNTYFTTLEKDENLVLIEKKRISKKRKLRRQQGRINNQTNINEEFYIREYEAYLNDKIADLKKDYDFYAIKIDNLKEKRKKLSADGQKQIFEKYQFLNQKKEEKNLTALFKKSNTNIPAGAGDCCAPKLLQYAFLNNLTPIAMAEFWWGKPLNSSVRKHKYYYPACKGKCKPILEHMLKDIPTEVNPLFEKLAKKKELTIIYEDDYLLVINKPNELLTVSGTEIKDSVQYRIQKQYPNATGPLIVHRLDMSTSGILLIAKTKDIHKALQKQFIEKTVRKRYIALLNGKLESSKGTIKLPLKVDFFDRPKQMICFKEGKKATTNYDVIEYKNSKTRVYFYPITGRTHQLRMHASHHLGLNIPIIGDDLYGIPSERLCLHAERIIFTHPITKQEVSFIADCPF